MPASSWLEWLKFQGKTESHGKKDVFIRKVPMYQMDWMKTELDLYDHLVSAAPFSGPIALIKDPHLSQDTPNESENMIFIYTNNGHLISKIRVCKKLFF